jgi:hypothetical protein
MQSEYTAHALEQMRPRVALPLLIAEYGNYCFKCGVQPPIDDVLCVDHIVPVARGGKNVYANYQLLCDGCNTEKFLRVIDYRPGTLRLDVTWERPIIPIHQRARRSRSAERETEEQYTQDGCVRVVSVLDAARLLRMSEATVKRRIAAGILKADTVARPQGWTYMVHIPEDAIPNGPTESPLVSPTSIEPSCCDQRALDILETLLVANGATMERQAEQITRLTGEAWEARALARVAEARLEATNDALRSAQQAVSAAQVERDAWAEMTQRQSRQIEAQAESLCARDEAIIDLEQQLAAERAERERQRPWWKWWRSIQRP